MERCLTAKLEDARDALVNKAIEVLAVYRANFAKNIAGTTLMIPDQLRHFVLMILALIKHVRFFGGGQRDKGGVGGSEPIVRGVPRHTHVCVARQPIPGCSQANRLF